MIKKLTKKQKQQCDQVVSLLQKLSDDGITFYMNSTPSLEIGFCRTKDNIDFDDWKKFINGPDRDKYYSPVNKIRLENYGY